MSPHLSDLATQLTDIFVLDARERAAILQGTEEAVAAAVAAKLTRVLLVELNAARVEGRLSGQTAEQRWNNFIALSSKLEFWESISEHYPTLLTRTSHVINNRCIASLRFANEWAGDKARLSPLLGSHAGELSAVVFGAGDSHRGGRTVAMVTCDGGTVVYKPRSLVVDALLRNLIAELAGGSELELFLRVPASICSDGHGWAEFIAHRHAASRDELRAFYRGIGHWLALMRLLGATDLHSENLIAHGKWPVMVDCETLFTPKIPPSPSGLGDAAHRAGLLVSGTVLASGLLPSRRTSLGFRGVDSSGVGSLPGQQPAILLPDIVNPGTDEARIGSRPMEIPMAQNHPAAEPSLADFWPDVLNGFDELSHHLRKLDAQGFLRDRLEVFEPCCVRVVVRPTESYAELARMLWHPVSLHNEEKARHQASDLLTKMAENVSLAPSEPSVIQAEIDELLIGDIPFFATIAGHGVLEGPSGTRWLSQDNLVEAAWKDWRKSDLSVERNYVQAALTSAYVSQGWMPKVASLWPAVTREDNVESRRRAQAASLIRKLIETAIRGRDGTITWIAPILAATGWTVQPLTADLYNGISGLALLAGAYVREHRAGRADPVDGVESLLADLLRTLDAFEDKLGDNKKKGLPVRPAPVGGYLGLGSLIFCRLRLSEWDLDGGDGLERAMMLGREIRPAAASDELLDVLSGRAGAIVPLLLLWKKTANIEFLEAARAMGDQLCDCAQWRGECAYWIHALCPNGMGGFAHGVSGIGWALQTLADASAEDRYSRIAEAAFAFEDSLFDESEQNWTDLRKLEGSKTAAGWCHGSVGIGLARLDHDPTLANEITRKTLRRAVAATWRLGFGWNHSTCHGDTGAWEFIDRAIAAGEGPEGVSREHLLASIITSIEDHGPIAGLLRNTFMPGVFTGLGGVAYQLLRAHPESALPSILVMGS
ncbi:MAG TPA: type 2 lanthipeptide synthetase LanM family protein [Bryobacteraceae bacterium]